MPSRFLEIHTLTSYSASLLNRDDVGLAKRIPFGGSVRTRISSQCLKRHWRRADDEHALDRISVNGEAVPMSVRSRRTFERYLYKPLVDGGADPEVAKAVTDEIRKTVLPDSKAKQAASKEADEGEKEAASLRTQQVTVIGRPEINHLLGVARDAVAEAGDVGEAKEALKTAFKGEVRKNLQALGQGAGLDAALFGRMTTGDILARCDAAVHVAHAFTVHDGELEIDYFSAVDDLQGTEETGSGHINTSELSTGLYYGYVVVDIPLLVSNLDGCERSDWTSVDRSLAAEVVRRLLHLVATISPGAKLGSTAPYAHASMVLVEAGNRQPRTLANAFLDAVPKRGVVSGAMQALASYLERHDAMYGRGQERRLAVLEPTEELLAQVDERLDLPGLARWTGERIEGTS